MSTLTIKHTDVEGTLLHGTSRGDRSAEVVKGLRWRWGRSIGCWYVPRSRDVPPKRALIAQTAAALEEAGFTVAVSIEAAVAEQDEAEQRRGERADARAERLQERAERHGAAAEQRWNASRELADRIPFGQPILVGHHSQRRAERDAERIRGHMDASVELQREADRAAAAAAAAAADAGARHNPVTVANRVERLGAQLRADERELDKLVPAGLTVSTYEETLRDRLEHTQAELEHWQGVRSQQIADGIATNYSRTNVAAGDLVKIRGRWYRVARANVKTVAVETGYSWTNKGPWHEVQEHRAAAGE